MGTSAGGAFLPSDPPSSTGQVLTSPTITSPTIAGATLTTATLTSPTVSTPTITNAAISGTGTTIAFQSAAITATGTTGTDATAIAIGAPGLITVTGASGAGIGIPTGAATAGAAYWIRNINATGVQKVYAVGGTINGTTGTTALSLEPTGTKSVALMCVVAGAWQVAAISTL